MSCLTVSIRRSVSVSRARVSRPPCLEPVCLEPVCLEPVCLEPVSRSVSCDNFLYGFKGAPPGAPRPDGPGREQRGRARAAERERAARVTRRRRPGFTRGSRRCGAAAFAASFGRKPYGAATAAHGSPGDRPPAVPAVSRCRARQHHGQAVTARAECADRREDVTATGPERRALSGSAPPASRAPEDRF